MLFRSANTKEIRATKTIFATFEKEEYNNWKMFQIPQQGETKITHLLVVSTGLGFMIAIPLVGTLLLGLWLDRHFLLFPWCTLALTTLGFVMVFLGLYRYLKPSFKRFLSKR